MINVLVNLLFKLTAFEVRLLEHFVQATSDRVTQDPAILGLVALVRPLIDRDVNENDPCLCFLPREAVLAS